MKRGVNYGPPEPELILSAAVIGVRGIRKSEKKPSPIKGGGSTVSDPKTVTDKTTKHKKVSFTTSRAEIRFHITLALLDWLKVGNTRWGRQLRLTFLID